MWQSLLRPFIVLTIQIEARKGLKPPCYKNSDCFALTRNDNAIVITSEWNERSNPQKRNFIQSVLLRFVKQISQWQKFVNFINNKGFQPLVLTVQREARKGLKPPCYKNLDCFALTRNDKIFRNNENLLTSFN